MGTPDRARYEKAGTEAALAAGDLLMKRFRTRMNVTHKGVIDLVTEVDLAAEALIVSALQHEFPGCAILAEEGHSGTARGPVTWIIDPLDGTTNYAHGLPFFSVSIGLEIEGEIEFGVVYIPTLGEVFTARRGLGACLNGTPIRVSAVSSLGTSLLTTGFPYDIRTSRETNLEYFAEFSRRSFAVRRAGSAAMDFCYVAAGRYDGFWEIKLNPWDCAAGYLIVREAGGRVTNFHGRPGSIYDRESLATNGLIHDSMLNILSQPGATAAEQH
jgi:myo-inositol-1(or 4)-monophosphatase